LVLLPKGRCRAYSWSRSRSRRSCAFKLPSDISADPMTIHRNNKRRGVPRRLFSHSVDHSLTKAVGIEPPQQKGQADHTETHGHHIRESPDHFQSDQKHKKQPEVHRSALPKAKCPLLKVLTRSRSPKRPDLAGEITEKSLALKSEKAFS